MTLNPEEGKAFGNISVLYDAARITYPEQLIADIIDFSNIKPKGTILDIGCGTGQATLPLVQKQFKVTGLDISQQMIDVAKEKCPNADFKVGTFEDAELAENTFDLIVSGMAWHWVSSKNRYNKVHRILKENGTLALFWSYQQKEKSEFVMAVSKILDKYDGVNRGPAGSLVKETADKDYNDLKKSDLFASVDIKTYEVNFDYTLQNYIDLVTSYGWVQKLPDDKRTNLIKDLNELSNSFTEPLSVPYCFILVLAK
ncbi:methyltransferase domain-containing protein [Candidatus Woesearchaeota archaeon]|jgi:ubiquinone/menaquinone biosynthesis C-methylase UbiE|nr:methyltransferase domain-containing protein [Candidatus Woesearchaeota archaeon]MBT3537861.1 methyltransferase domain-containing protein [Candidatus Woesearchaeota archaeon]MBT4697992.1 methyltransferase domain-containing protein [Candidatus Woesearchaeota archaeon]MBT4717667.1 methyltransferase domain-containing protein [Candidatus Woesearchaeota archaeon]MBT7105530.1 methyltransferase domain-containing protein [Candidatus Woesearchaeota archaeon]